MKFYIGNWNLAFIRLMLFFPLLVSSCSEVEERGTLEKDTTPPHPISQVQVTNLPGAAQINYALPDDNDLLYVLAEYEIRPGVKQQVRASYYNNSLKVEGFGKVGAYPVNLYTVDRSGNQSAAQTVTVNPLTAPVFDVFDQLDYDADFGGIHVSFMNKARADIGLAVLIKDQFGDWIDYDKYYTALPQGNFSVRGLPAVPTWFGVYVDDRWNNVSDTLIREITPRFETMLDKSKFQALVLPGDPPNAWTLPGLWDDKPASGQGFSSTGPFPKHFQFSVGIKAKLSRFTIWGIFDGREYSSGNPREFEVWGSNDPNADGSFDGWTLLGTYTIVKPSGLPGNDVSSDDSEQAAAGFEFNVPAEAPAVRYIRFNILSTFASPRNSQNGAAWVRELTFWGGEEE